MFEKMFKRTDKSDEKVDSKYYFTVFEIMGLVYCFDGSLSASFSYYDRDGEFQCTNAKFKFVKKFEFFEGKMDNHTRNIPTGFTLVNEDIPEFYVSDLSDYLVKYIEKDTVIATEDADDLKHYAVYSYAGEMAHIIASETPQLSEI